MIRVLAPAKLNLGLEVLGRLDDGFHEVRTIYCAVSLFDRVTVEESSEPSVVCTPGIEHGNNLAQSALDLAMAGVPLGRPARVKIKKRIPFAAGLGGASSDAAATLLALAHVRGDSSRAGALSDLAPQCGSDVPFFLRSGMALGSGRGEVIEPIASQPLHAIVITPHVTIRDKTKTMYGLIQQSDWTDGANVDNLASALNRGEPLDPFERLPNAFRRPLYDLLPEVGDLAAKVEALLGAPVQVSGAGPSLYVLCASAADAQLQRRRLQSAIGKTNISTSCIRSVSTVLMSEIQDG
jgi:4-diphosphocytidyl-2-C-methyl-D-erythritol kinase